MQKRFTVLGLFFIVYSTTAENIGRGELSLQLSYLNLVPKRQDPFSGCAPWTQRWSHRVFICDSMPESGKPPIPNSVSSPSRRGRRRTVANCGVTFTDSYSIDWPIRQCGTSLLRLSSRWKGVNWHMSMYLDSWGRIAAGRGGGWRRGGGGGMRDYNLLY